MRNVIKMGLFWPILMTFLIMSPYTCNPADHTPPWHPGSPTVHCTQSPIGLLYPVQPFLLRFRSVGHQALCNRKNYTGTLSKGHPTNQDYLNNQNTTGSSRNFCSKFNIDQSQYRNYPSIKTKFLQSIRWSD